MLEKMKFARPDEVGVAAMETAMADKYNQSTVPSIGSSVL